MLNGLIWGERREGTGISMNLPPEPAAANRGHKRARRGFTPRKSFHWISLIALSASRPSPLS
jgi:hypothetical protein